MLSAFWKLKSKVDLIERAFIPVFSVLFTVSGVQEFLTRPQDTAVIKGQTATMKCAVENRAGTIQWAKDGLMLGKVLFLKQLPHFSLGLCLTLLHSERPKLYTILTFLSAVGLNLVGGK